MKPSVPKGTRDFDAATISKRQYILDIIRKVFELYGFEPLETPAFENLETLMGKYGDEGDKLIFKILNNGLDNPDKREGLYKSFEKILEGTSQKNISERALRYDLTIPFARYVALNYGKLILPFKRYQIQPVWRADRPQKGRYREFYQCDADIAGTTSIISDIELAGIYFKVFKELKIPVVIKMNNRKILAGLAEICDVGNLSTISTAIDKIDKIGMHEVEKELYANGLVNAQVATIRQYLSIAGNNREKLDAAAPLFEGNKMGKSGIDEMNAFLAFSDHDAYAKEFLQIDFTLARGLNYYTGVIYEVQATDVQIGSIGGGGRYDDLTGLFGLPNVPGVGISFGVDRIYDVMEELNLFPENIMKSTTVLFLNLGNDESKFSFYAMQNLRDSGVSCELFYDNAKLEKQFKYASRKNIRFAVIIGSREAEEKNCQIKDLHTGQQATIPISELNTYFAKK